MGDHETVDMIRIPLPGKPKARPRVAKGNTTKVGCRLNGMAR